MRAISILLPVGLALAAARTTAAADEKTDPTALSLAKSFAKICVLAVPDFQNVIVEARIEGWKQVEGPPRDRLVIPKGEPVRSSWVTKGVDGLPIGVTISREPRRDVFAMEATCAVQNPDVAPAGMADALAAILPLPEPAKPIVEGERAISVWSLLWGNRTLTIAMVAHASRAPGIIVNAVIQQNVR